MYKKKIKVAFFADILEREVDGASRTMYQLIDRIPKDKFEFMFFSGSIPKTELKNKITKVPSLMIPFNSSYKIAFPYFRNVSLVKAMREFNPDVIHIATPSWLGFFALNYANNNEIPVLSIYHTHFISYIKYYFKSFPFMISAMELFAAKKYRDFYNKCNIVYTPTHQMINELKYTGVSTTFLKLWQRGLDTTLFNAEKKDDEFMRKITGNNKPCVLFASRLVWEKNLETLFNIYDKVEAEHLDVNFIVAGTGVAEENARQRMKNAFFLGHIDHHTLSKVYASSEILVFPSVSETYGNVVIEAMASGCVPVIAKGGGSQSLVENGTTGFLCKPNSASEYVENIKMILQKPELKAKMQQAGYQYTSKLSWENLAMEYFNDIEYLSQFAPIRSNVFSLRDITSKSTYSKRWATDY